MCRYSTRLLFARRYSTPLRAQALGRLHGSSNRIATLLSVRVDTLEVLHLLHKDEPHMRRISQLHCMWQNHLNYAGSSALAITMKATPAQTHFKRNNSWSVG